MTTKEQGRHVSDGWYGCVWVGGWFGCPLVYLHPTCLLVACSGADSLKWFKRKSQFNKIAPPLNSFIFTTYSSVITRYNYYFILLLLLSSSWWTILHFRAFFLYLFIFVISLAYIVYIVFMTIKLFHVPFQSTHTLLCIVNGVHWT